MFKINSITRNDLLLQSIAGESGHCQTIWNSYCLQWTAVKCSETQWRQKPFLTSLTSDDHGLRDEREELIQHLMEEEDQRFQAGRGQGDDAQLQLVLQLVLRNLLLPHAQRERRSPLQSVAECEEALQVVVLLIDKEVKVW